MSERRNFTPKTKGIIRKRSQGLCEVHLVPRCMYPALPEACKRIGAEVDHITPAYVGGGNGADNGAFLCGLCHKIKTYTDNREAKKSNRLQGKTGNGPKRKIPSRPMAKAKRQWPKRKFNTRAEK